MGFNIPSELPNEQVAIAAWKKLTGKSLTKSVLTLSIRPRTRCRESSR